MLAERGGGAQERVRFEVVGGMEESEAVEFLKIEGLWQEAHTELLTAVVQVACDRLTLLRELAAIAPIKANGACS